ncbi:MAG: serine protease [Acidimicrobiales bacterium]|jgi:S1-C subfamily serine protease|nr:serine protease [Acidimicrobiales bacterium]MDP6697775.1 serine protease [Acidimicrobiales bacterium]
MWVFAADSASEIPEWIADARVIPAAYDPILDLAVLRLVDMSGNPTYAPGRNPIEVKNIELGWGDEIRILGYPAMGGQRITITSGEISGWWTGDGTEYYKSSAKSGPGVSGGAAFDSNTGDFIGVPTLVTLEEVGDQLGMIRANKFILQYLEIARNSG